MMKKLMIGALMLVAMAGCEDRSKFITDFSETQEVVNRTVETNISLRGKESNSVHRVYVDEETNSYFIVGGTHRGLPDLYKFDTLNREVISQNGYEFVKDDTEFGIKQVQSSSPTSNVINIVNNNSNNTPVQKVEKVPLMTKSDWEKQEKVNAKQDAIDKAKRELEKMEKELQSL